MSATNRIFDEDFRLGDQPHHQRNITLPSRELGLRVTDGKPEFHKPKMKLAHYYDSATAQPPSAVSRALPSGFTWPMLRNDQLGDCVPAGKLHAVQGFHIVAGTPVPNFVDADATLWYEKDGGYNPNDPSTDQGCDESVAMTNWEAGMPRTSDGVVHEIVGTIAIDPHNDLECRIAVDEFVVIVNAILLPVSAQGQTKWTVVGDGQSGDSAPGSWGGHCTIDWEYDPVSFGQITWGEELLEDLSFRHAYHVEAHVNLAKEMLNNQGIGPSGVQWGDLLSDMRKFVPAA